MTRFPLQFDASRIYLNNKSYRYIYMIIYNMYKYIYIYNMNI